VKSVWVYVVVENPYSILEVPEEALNRATQKFGELSKTLLTAPRYHGPRSVRITGSPTQAPPPQPAQESERVLHGPG